MYILKSGIFYIFTVETGNKEIWKCRLILSFQ